MRPLRVCGLHPGQDGDGQDQRGRDPGDLIQLHDLSHLFAQAALDAMCSYLPKSISAQCTTFVDTYTPMIIDMLTKVGMVVVKRMR